MMIFISLKRGLDMYNIVESTKEEADIVLNGLIEYNSGRLPFKGDVPFIPVNRVMKDSDGNIIAGATCELNYYWSTLFIDILWVKEAYRKKGCGSKLLKELEKLGKEILMNLIDNDLTLNFEVKNKYALEWSPYFGYALEEDWKSKVLKQCDILFRILLIMHYSGCSKLIDSL